MKNLKIFLVICFVTLTTIFVTAQSASNTVDYDYHAVDFPTQKHQENPAISKEVDGMNYPTLHKTIEVNGVDIFYREAGDKNAPTLLLLHGYPTSSHMFRNLIADLSDKYHLIAPDYPGYGNSEQPTNGYIRLHF